MEPISVQVYRTVILLIIIVTMVMACAVESPSAYGICVGSSWACRMYYHFFHGGIIHWFVNAVAILTIAFRFQLAWYYYLLSFIIAAMYPFSTSVPVVGLSVWIYCLIGIITPITAYPFRVIVLNGFCIFAGLFASVVSQWMSSFIGHCTIPVIAWQAHLYAYISGIALGLLTMPVWKRQS